MVKGKNIRITSPKGVARYAWLTRPNTKFNPDGVYSVDLVLPAAEAASFMETIDKYTEEALEKARTDNPKYKKEIKAGLPYKMETDDEGEETGNVIIKFKKNAVFKDKETGKVTPYTIKFFDAKGNPVPNMEGLFGGSIIKVNATVRPYFVAGTKMAGVSLSINAVQVIEKGVGGSAKDFGFDEEDGYDAASETPALDIDFVTETEDAELPPEDDF